MISGGRVHLACITHHPSPHTLSLSSCEAMPSKRAAERYTATCNASVDGCNWEWLQGVQYPFVAKKWVKWDRGTDAAVMQFTFPLPSLVSCRGCATRIYISYPHLRVPTLWPQCCSRQFDTFFLVFTCVAYLHVYSFVHQCDQQFCLRLCTKSRQGMALVKACPVRCKLTYSASHASQLLSSMRQSRLPFKDAVRSVPVRITHNWLCESGRLHCSPSVAQYGLH